MFSIDCNELFIFCRFGMMLFTTPALVFFSVILLYNELGYVGFIAIFVILYFKNKLITLNIDYIGRGLLQRLDLWAPNEVKIKFYYFSIFEKLLIKIL